MKIEKLTSGMIVKNYKTLCELLEIDIKSGNSKIAQLKEIKRYVKYHNEGQKFIIDEVCKIKLEKNDNRGGNNKVFIDDFKTLMLYMMKKNKSQELLLSKSALYRASNLVNENYLKARQHISKLAEIVNLPQEAIYEFYDYNSTKIRQTADRNLRKMRSECILVFEEVHAVAIYENVIDVDLWGNPIMDANGNLVYVNKVVHRQATTEENSIILKHERNVMKEMNFKNLQNVFLSGRWKEFKTEVEKRLSEDKTNIVYYYGAYKITWNDEKLEEIYNEYCADIDINKVKSNINGNMQKSIIKANKTRCIKAKSFNGFGTAITNRIEYQRSDRYLEEQEQLTFILIDEGAESIVYELEQPIKDYKKLSELNDKLNLEQLEFNQEVPF